MAKIKYTGILPVCPNCDSWTKRDLISFDKIEEDISTSTYICHECEREFTLRFLNIEYEQDMAHGGSVDRKGSLLINNIEYIREGQYYSSIRTYIHYEVPTYLSGASRGSDYYMIKKTLVQFIEWLRQIGIDNQTIERWLH